MASDWPTTRAGSVVLIDIRPRGEATVTADRAWMRFDVTELYFEVRFAPLDRDADTAPQLRWTAARDC